jgi:hypothetical protein
LKVAKDLPVDFVELDSAHEQVLQIGNMRNNITIAREPCKGNASLGPASRCGEKNLGC